MPEQPGFADIANRIDAFKVGLTVEPDDVTFVERYVLHGSCFAVTEDVQYMLKERIAGQFGVVALTDIFVVGSAKLGFSIKPAQRWKHFDEQSDVDVAIVSHDMYQTVWHELHEYHISGDDWPSRGRFVEYLAQGWIRPDLLPPSKRFSFGDQWWDFFRALKAEQLAGPCKINAGLYHDLLFLTKYQAGGVAACRSELASDAD